MSVVHSAVNAILVGDFPSQIAVATADGMVPVNARFHLVGSLGGRACVRNVRGYAAEREPKANTAIDPLKKTKAIDQTRRVDFETGKSRHWDEHTSCLKWLAREWA